MEKTKDQILIETLRKAGRKLHAMRHGKGRHCGPMGHGFEGPKCGPMGHGFGPGMGPGFEGPKCGPRPGFGPGMAPGFAPGMGRGFEGPKCGPMGPHHGRPGMFPRERILLIVLNADENGIRQKDIAAELGIHAPALTEQIDRLEQDRYIERVANPDDRRSTLIRLTEKGRARAYEVADERSERAAEFCSALTDEEKDELIALLEKLLAEPETDELA